MPLVNQAASSAFMRVSVRRVTRIYEDRATRTRRLREPEYLSYTLALRADRFSTYYLLVCSRLLVPSARPALIARGSLLYGFDRRFRRLGRKIQDLREIGKYRGA